MVSSNCFENVANVETVSADTQISWVSMWSLVRQRLLTKLYAEIACFVKI